MDTIAKPNTTRNWFAAYDSYVAVIESTCVYLLINPICNKMHPLPFAVLEFR